MELILLGIYTAMAWNMLSSLQRDMGITYFGTLQDYFFGKIVVCVFLGWLIIPFGLLRKLLK